MFYKLLCSVVLVGFAGAVVPPYIHVCGARNPNLDKCIIESVEALIPNIKTGIPELDVPSVEPLLIDQVDLANSPSFKARATNTKVWGLANYTVKYLHTDLEKKVIDIELHYNKHIMEAEYNVTAKILVDLSGKGPIQVNTTDVTAKTQMLYKIVERGGKNYIFFYSMKTNLSIGDYTAHFTTDGFDKALQDAINEALTSSRAEILQLTKPNLEKAISKKTLDVANKICKHFTYDELFPDRE